MSSQVTVTKYRDSEAVPDALHARIKAITDEVRCIVDSGRLGCHGYQWPHSARQGAACSADRAAIVERLPR